MVKWQRIEEGECESISDVPEGAFPVEVDGLEVEGVCENCGTLLFEGDKYFLGDEELICEKCAEELVEDPDDTSMDE